MIGTEAPTEFRPTEFWQSFTQAPAETPALWTGHYAAPMPDGTRLTLPLRDLGDTAIAGLIANQASFAVHDRFVAWMAQACAPLRADVVVALPTLGHSLGAGLARALGHANWVALGTSRKLWYDEALSVPLSSVTSPTAGRRLWLDPRLLGRVQGRRVLLVDDVLSTGSSARAALSLLDAAGITPVGVCAAMLQGNRWQAGWNTAIPVTAAFATPLFAREPGGWRQRADTCPSALTLAR